MKETTIRPTNDIAFYYNQYKSELLSYFVCVTSDRMSAEDLLHDLFIRLMETDYIDPDTIHSLLFVAAKRIAIDYSRHTQCVIKAEAKLLRDSKASVKYCTPEIRIDYDMINQKKDTIIKSLSPIQQKVFTLYTQNYLSSNEIAETMGISKRTVENHIYRTRVELKSKLRNII